MTKLKCNLLQAHHNNDGLLSMMIYFAAKPTIDVSEIWKYFIILIIICVKTLVVLRYIDYTIHRLHYNIPK